MAENIDSMGWVGFHKSMAFSSGLKIHQEENFIDSCMGCNFGDYSKTRQGELSI